ncbi:MAG: thiosulfate/3-mercaptopyruvate sulfurtransferase [Cocleimonas sp.]|jgi:thiosulfate/3-mercaptopyruvate sulfurtransferase
MIYQTIISPTDLAKNLHLSEWLILDCRGGFLDNEISYHSFIESHIPGAFYCTFTENYMANLKHNNPNIKPSSSAQPAKIMEYLKENGFNKTSQIIIYDDTSSSVTDTVWLLLRSIGCQNVAVLQGGYASWEHLGMPVSTNKNLQ